MKAIVLCLFISLFMIFLVSCNNDSSGPDNYNPEDKWGISNDEGKRTATLIEGEGIRLVENN